MRGLIIDSFAGGGGASTGIEQALGRPVDVAINHDREAVAMHEANHPSTRHYTQDIWAVAPLEVTGGQPVQLAWFSPDCKHFSKAKGGKPVEKKIRDLAWVVVEWARAVQPAVIMLENVEEFRTWGPLDDAGLPIKAQRGETWEEWLGQLRALGYEVQWRELRACDFGAPTIRKRLFVIARRDGEPIRWPAPTHGRNRTPYRTAAECIDWSIPTPSIFLTREEGRAIGVNRPLVDATMRRIAAGIRRFVIESPNPFIVPLTHQGGERVESIDEPMMTVTGANRGEKAIVVPSIVGVGGRMGQSAPRSPDEPYQTITAKGDAAIVTPYLVGITHNQSPSMQDSVDEPVRTLTTSKGGELAVVAPTLVQTGYGEREGQAPRAPGLDKPLGTIVSGGKHALVNAFIQKHFTGVVGSDLDEPLGTVTAWDHNSLVAAAIVRNNHDGQGKPADPVDEPLRTVTTQHNKHSVVAAHLAKHFTGQVGADTEKPLPTITARNQTTKLVTSNLVKLYGTNAGASVADPMPTVTAGGQHVGEVRAFLAAYYGNDKDGQAVTDPFRTVTSKERFGLVTIHGEVFEIVDIGMRMLAPRELFRAQGFPESYVIAPVVNGKALNKTAQIRMCGNSVCPPMARALVHVNLVDSRDAAEPEGQMSFPEVAG